jgi:hypothetical protein
MGGLKRAAVAVGLLIVGGCSPTSAELLRGGHWSSRARAACSVDPALRGPAISCSSAVQVMASEGAGRKDVNSTDKACALSQGPLIVAAAAIGPLLDAAGQLAAALAEQLREREAIRQAVLRQATADLEAEQLCFPQQPLPAPAP